MVRVLRRWNQARKRGHSRRLSPRLRNAVPPDAVPHLLETAPYVTGFMKGCTKTRDGGSRDSDPAYNAVATEDSDPLRLLQSAALPSLISGGGPTSTRAVCSAPGHRPARLARLPKTTRSARDLGQGDDGPPFDFWHGSIGGYTLGRPDGADGAAPSKNRRAGGRTSVSAVRA